MPSGYPLRSSYFLCVCLVCILVYRNLGCPPLPLGVAITAVSVADTAAINAANVNLMCQLSPSYKAAAAIAQIATTTATSLLFQLLFLLLCFLSFSPPSFHVPQLDSVPLLDSTLSEYGLTPTLHPPSPCTLVVCVAPKFSTCVAFFDLPVKKKIIISYINMK